MGSSVSDSFHHGERQSKGRFVFGMAIHFTGGLQDDDAWRNYGKQRS